MEFGTFSLRFLYLLRRPNCALFPRSSLSTCSGLTVSEKELCCKCKLATDFPRIIDCPVPILPADRGTYALRSTSARCVNKSKPSGLHVPAPRITLLAYATQTNSANQQWLDGDNAENATVALSVPYIACSRMRWSSDLEMSSGIPTLTSIC